MTSPNQTSAGTVLGTAGYMSPEQVRGEAVDNRSDIFSLGAILYEMISGQRAFRGDSSVEVMTSILKAGAAGPERERYECVARAATDRASLPGEKARSAFSVGQRPGFRPRFAEQRRQPRPEDCAR